MVRAVNLTRDAGTQSEDKTSESAINQPDPITSANHQCIAGTATLSIPCDQYVLCTKSILLADPAPQLGITMVL